MRKMIAIALVALFIPVMAQAAVQTENLRREGGFESISVLTASIATNAIDTTVVKQKISPAWVEADTLGQAEYVWPIAMFGYGRSGTGGSGTVDSVQVAIDLSADGTTWYQLQALGTTARIVNATGYYTTAYTIGGTESALKCPLPYVRLRLKNTGAATGQAGVTLSWPAK